MTNSTALALLKDAVSKALDIEDFSLAALIEAAIAALQEQAEQGESCPTCDHNVMVMAKLRAELTAPQPPSAQPARTAQVTDEQIMAIWNNLDGPAIIKDETHQNWNNKLRVAFARALLAPTPAKEREQAERQYLNELDFAQLFRFNECCQDFDSGGHDLPKDDVKRLCELGALRSVGFGRHEITAFGTYVIEYTFLQDPNLPLKTTAEHNAATAPSQDKT